MRPIYSVMVDDTMVCLFDEKASAYKLRNEKRQDGKDASVDKQILFDDLADRERLRS